MVGDRARVLQVEREHARPRLVAIEGTAAQRKRRPVPKGSHVSRFSPGFPGLLTASMRLVFFADLADRHGGKSLLSLCSGPGPVSLGYLA